MKKLFFIIPIFFLLITGTFANNIFENYPWLTDLVEQENCSTEKVEVYQSGIFTYLLVTDADAVAILYNDAGTFYCQSASNFDCVALYNLVGPVDIWDCATNNSSTCSVTITNTLCRFISVYDENDNLLTQMAGGPAPNGPPGQVAPEWEDSRPLGATESRTYIFKENNFVLGRQTVSCANPQIESVSNYTDGCNDGVGLAQLKNTGCRTITAYNTGGGVVGNYAPDEEFLLSTGPFIHILVAGMDTLAIISDDNTSMFAEIDSGGCGEEGDGCFATVTNTQCRRVGIYDENDNLLTTMNNGPAPNGPPGIVAPIWEDSRPLGATESRTYIFKEGNLVLGRQTVSCANPKIEVVSNYFSGCTDAIGRAEITNIGCRTITVHNTNSEVIGTYGPGVTFDLSVGPQIYIFLAGTDTIGINQNENGLITLDSGGCETTSNPAIFQDYPWLTDLVDPNSCSTEKIDVYQSGIFNYLLVTDASGVEIMYNADGIFYCQNASNYDCIAAYGLGLPIDAWNCGANDCNCPQEVAPVCGVNNVTYNNACEAACAGVEIAFNTACNIDPPDACFFDDNNIRQLENQAISCSMTTKVTRIDYNGNSYFRTYVGRTKSSIEQLSQPCAVSEYFGNIRDCEGTIICEFSLTNAPPNFDPEVCDAIQRGLGTETVIWEHPEISCSVEDPFSLPVIQNAISQAPIMNESGEICSFIEEITQIDYAGFTYFGIKERFNAATGCAAQIENYTFYDCEGDFVGGIGDVPFCQSAILCNGLAVASGTVIWSYEGDEGTSNSVIFNDYPWLTDLVDPNSCSTEKVEVFQTGIFNYLLVRDDSGIETMYNSDGVFYCQNASNYDCIAAYNLGAAIDTWTCGEINANCANYSGSIFFEKCDDGRDFYFIRTSTGEVLDAYYAEGIDFLKYEGQKVNFDYELADFTTPCSIADKAVIITCIEENNSLSQSREQTISRENQVNFTLFPNPTEGQFTFQLRDKLEGSQQLQLVDLLGRTLYQQTIEPFTNSVELDLSAYQNGVYYVALYAKEKKVVMRKIVKQGLD